MPFTLHTHPKKVLLVAITSLCSLMSWPAQAQVQDLLSLYNIAKLRDPTYLSARAQTQADLEQENQAFGALLPNINANAQLKQDNTTNTLRNQSSERSTHPKSYGLTLNQALYRPQAWETYKQGQLSSEMAKLNLDKAEQDLIMRVSRAYFELLTAQDELTSLQAQKTATEEQLESAKQNFELGNATITDQQEAQARFDLIVAQELAAKNTIDRKNLALESVIGEPVSLIAPLHNSIALQAPQPENPEDWGDKAQQGNLDLLLAKTTHLIAKHEAQKAQYGHHPTIDFSAQMLNADQQMLDSTTGRSFDVSVDSRTFSLALNIPLYSGGASQSKVRQQASLLEKAANQLELANRTARQQVKSAYLAVNTGLAQVYALQTAISSSELALQANKTGYEVGVRVNIDVLNAQQQLSATQRDLAKAKYNALLSMLELKSAIGELDEKSVEEMNALLLPAP